MHDASQGGTGADPRPAHRPKPRVFLESRYRKLERGLPQTIFYCPDCKGDRRRARRCTRCEGFGKLTKDSVQELLGRVLLPAFKAKFGKFHGAGREDIDVLMLGRGRPFVYELVGVRQAEVELTELDARLAEVYAGRVEFGPLQQVARARVAYWKEGKFDKEYRLRVAASDGGEVDPSALQPRLGERLAVAQRTPQRVAHRRADLVRERWVELRGLGAIDGQGFELDIRCQHGTYVKEWVSGDGGRSTPSLSSLLGEELVCARLDVLEILDAED